MNHNHQIYRDRRTAVVQRMREQSGGGLALVPTAAEAARNRDSMFPYRHDSYFYYMSGFPEPEAVIALVADADGDRHVLFCREKDQEREIWDGFRYGPDAAREIFGFDEAHPIAELDRLLPELAADRPALYTPLGLFAAWDLKVSDLLNEVRKRVRTGVAAPEEIVDVRQAIDVLRLVKDEHEIALMRRAAAISAGAHRRAMDRTRVGWHEYQVEAELAHEFLRSGAQAVAYPSIVAGGPNACVLHYRENSRQLQDGELLLIDAGCEYQGYASDITRTFPVNGRFTGPQKAVYEVVLAAQQACLDAVRPGVEFHDYHKTAERVLAQGYIDLGLCRGHARRSAGDRALQAVLYAPGRPLARHGCPRRRPLSGEGRVAEARARHGADRRARHLHPARRQRARRILGHRHPDRGRRSRHRDRNREPDAGGAEIGGRCRGGVPPVTAPMATSPGPCRRQEFPRRHASRHAA